MSWSLRNNLREVKVYDVHPSPTENTERLSHFTAVDTIYFKFCDFNNLYTIDQEIKKIRSVRSVNVDCFECTSDTYHTPIIQTNSTVCVLPQIKQLDIRKFLYTCVVYRMSCKCF